MKMLATATVIRGNGACEAYMNGIMNEEIKKMTERYERKIEALSNELNATKNTEKRLFAEKLPMVHACTAKCCSPFSDIREKLEVAWAFVWYMGEKAKLWSYDNN